MAKKEDDLFDGGTWGTELDDGLEVVDIGESPKVKDIIKETTGKTEEAPPPDPKKPINVEKAPVAQPIQPIEEEEEESGISFKPLAQAMFEHNGWTFKDEFLEEDSLDGFNNLLSNIVAANSKPQYSNEVVERFDHYVANGGNPKDFIDIMWGQEDLSHYNLEITYHQKEILKNFYRQTTRFSEEKINKEIKRVEGLGELEEEAKDAFNYFTQEQEKKKANLEKELAQRKQQEQREYNEYIAGIQRSIKDAEHIAGFELNNAEKKDFFKYLTEVDPKTGYTKYQMELYNEPNSQLELAYLKYKGVNKKQLEKSLRSGVIQGVRETVSKFTESGGLGRNTASPAKKKDSSIDTSDFWK